MMMVRHCGFLVVQSYESRLVPGSRRCLLSTKGSSPSHAYGGNDGGDEYDVETEKCTEQQVNESATFWHFCN